MNMQAERLTGNEIDRLLSENRMRNEENELKRIPLDRENALIEKIRKGQYREISVASYESLSPHISHWSSDEKKIWEYNTVAYISAFVRAAIASGAAPDQALDFSDVMLSKLAEAKTLSQMHDCADTAAKTLAKMVHDSRMGKSTYLVEQCKTYISRNVLKKIYLADIADYVGVNPTYLSRTFSQKEGISIQNYIQKEKVEAACNMLKYSDYSICDIAQYVGFLSQSSFTVVFKRWKEVTPAEYRNQNKCQVFDEKKK